jgi:LDH2 family malate/lactate/ureidoglycolate dehydrogenase
MNFASSVIRQQIACILSAWKMKPEMAEITAEIMADTDLAGIDSHGISMLTWYEDKVLAGTLRLEVEPRVVRENAVTALIDAGAGLGHPAAAMAARLAADKAAVLGLGGVGVTNSHHFGPAGYYAKIISDRGLIGLATCQSRTVSVQPTRSKTRVFGTNPIACAAPARRNPPFLLDMATSTIAAQKIKVYAYQGKLLPAGWVLDENGQPISDAALARDNVFNTDKGGLSPLGGTAEMASHKGYGLGMMVQILGSVLVGGSFAPIDAPRGAMDKGDNIGHFFLAIDPKCFRSAGAFEDDLDDMIDFLHAQPPINPEDPVLVPGDPELRSRERRLKEGVPLSSQLVDKIRGISERCGAPFLLV